MRTTAIVRVSRRDCDCTDPSAGRRAGRAHLAYDAECADCGWTATAHVRVILDEPYTGLVASHRSACPAMVEARAGAGVRR